MWCRVYYLLSSHVVGFNKSLAPMLLVTFTKGRKLCLSDGLLT